MTRMPNGKLARWEYTHTPVSGNSILDNNLKLNFKRKKYCGALRHFRSDDMYARFTELLTELYVLRGLVITEK